MASVPISFSLPEDLIEGVRRLAEQRPCKQSQVAAEALRAYLEAEGVLSPEGQKDAERLATLRELERRGVPVDERLQDLMAEGVAA